MQIEGQQIQLEDGSHIQLQDGQLQVMMIDNYWVVICEFVTYGLFPPTDSDSDSHSKPCRYILLCTTFPLVQIRFPVQIVS